MRLRRLILKVIFYKYDLICYYDCLVLARVTSSFYANQTQNVYLSWYTKWTSNPYGIPNTRNYWIMHTIAFRVFRYITQHCNLYLNVIQPLPGKNRRSTCVPKSRTRRYSQDWPSFSLNCSFQFIPRDTRNRLRRLATEHQPICDVQQYEKINWSTRAG